MSGHFVGFLEEESAREMLRVIIPRLVNVNEANLRLYPLKGKQRLRQEIQKKMEDYKMPNSVFLVMCDKDFDDCKELKKELLGEVAKVAKNKMQRTKVRIVCCELESFYLGDLKAVGKALDLPRLHEQQNKVKFRMPDNNREKPSETLKNITKDKYQKTAGSRKIAPHLDLHGGNKSQSFNMLVSAIKELSAMLSKNGVA